MKEDIDDEIVVEEGVENGEEALKKLREKLKVCVAEKQEYLEGWQRLRADYANEKRDSAKLLATSKEFAFAEAGEKIIPLIDAFDLAFSSPKWAEVDAVWRTGIERLREEVMRTLKELGVEPFSPKGEKFDPASMSASREIEGEQGTVIEVDRVGFKSGEVVLRPAYVAVGK